jgi:hypothetical protein
MKRLQSTESLKQDIQEQKSEKGSFFKRIMSTESLKFGVKKSGSKSSLLDPPTSESNNDHSIEKEKSRFGLRKSGSKSSLVDSPASQSNNDSPVEQKSKFKFGVKKSGSRSSLLDLPASQPVEEKKSIVQESQEVGPSETSELANSIAVSADELKPVVKPTEIKVDSIPKKPLSRLEALLNADSVEEKKSGVSYEYKEVVQSKEQVQTVPPPIPSTHTKPVSQKAVSPVHQTFERKDQDHSPIKEKKIEVVNEAPSVPIVQDVVKESNPEESPVTNSHKVGPKTGRFLNAMDMASIENKSVLKPSESKVEPVNPQKEETPEKVEVEKVAVLPAKPAEQEIKTPEPAKAEVHKETPEEYLAKPQTVTWKDHKVILKVIDFELHANETGKCMMK